MLYSFIFVSCWRLRHPVARACRSHLQNYHGNTLFRAYESPEGRGDGKGGMAQPVQGPWHGNKGMLGAPLHQLAKKRTGQLQRWVFLILALRCALAQFSHGVRSQLPQRLESTSCTLFSPRDIDALLRSFVSSMEYSLRMIERCWPLHCNGDFVTLAAANSPTCAICRNYMLIHNSSPYNHEWWPIFE